MYSLRAQIQAIHSWRKRISSTTAQFYVMAYNGTLVPAKILTGNNGVPISNPNSANNPAVNAKCEQYYTITGDIMETTPNPHNYLVVPVNDSINLAVQFSNDVNAAALQGIPPSAMMIGGFVGTGSQNLQRTYQNIDGSMTYAGSSVPMFQSAASFHLGMVAQLTGYGPVPAQFVGSLYPARDDCWLWLLVYPAENHAI